jgi:hypothetical protein
LYIFLFCVVGISLGLVGWQLAVWSGEISQKNKRYEAAVAYARKSGKPLLIAGGPWSNRGIRRWLNMPAHGYGDVCFDIERRAFEGHPCGLIADVTQIPFSDKAFGAAFASHLLEHMPTIGDAKRALEELNRVAKVVFIAYPSRQSIGAWLHRGHHLWVWQKGNAVYFEQRGNSAGEKIARYHLIDTVG